MDPTPDNEIELLESYLDGALPAARGEHVRDRVAADPALAAALDRLLGEREARQAVWHEMEPDSATADRLANLVVMRARHSSLRQRGSRLGQFAAAAAACLALGFAAGRVGHVPAPRAAMPLAHASGSSAPWASGPTTPAIAAEPVAVAPVYQVALTDEAGKIAAVQTFDTMEKAQAFAADVSRWQLRQQQARTDQPVATATRF